MELFCRVLIYTGGGIPLPGNGGGLFPARLEAAAGILKVRVKNPVDTGFFTQVLVPRAQAPVIALRCLSDERHAAEEKKY